MKPTAKVKPEKCTNSYHKCDINQRRDGKNGAVHPPPTSKTKHKYSGRVGEVAATIMKMYKVSTNVNDLFIDENDQDRIARKSRNERKLSKLMSTLQQKFHQAAAILMTALPNHQMSNLWKKVLVAHLKERKEH